MEALAISAANLDVIEQNLGAVAKELNGVVNNVADANSHISDIEGRVDTLNKSIDGLIKEIRETTVITDARQSIMYNDSKLEKKFGYYDNVRRATVSLVDSINHSDISEDALINLKNQLLLNNPNYWLANALAAVSYWVLDDKENAYKELNNSLRKNEEKTSLFFILINLKYKRIDSSVRWLSKYLSLQNPVSLDKDFITILDLVASGTFGDEAKDVVLKKIGVWLTDLSSEKVIQDSNIDIWKNFIYDYSYNDTIFNSIDNYVKDNDLIMENLNVTCSYERVLNHLESITNNNGSSKNVDKILEDLIFEYEDEEQQYKKENYLSSLVISCNGDRVKAQELYLKEQGALDVKTDLVSLFSNIVIHKDLFNISLETQKIVLAYVAPFITKAYEEINSSLFRGNFEIIIDDFITRTSDGLNVKNINSDLKLFLDNKYSNNDRDLLVVLIVVNLIGLIGLFLTLNNSTFLGILTVFLIVSDAILLFKLVRKNSLNKLLKDKYYSDYMNRLEIILAEIVDYSNIVKSNNNKYQELVTFLNILNVNNFINNNGERNIDIDGK